MKVAIIPARGGSKRIPHKNIKHFAGKPIIAYSIEAALTSGCFDKVVVSTDDPKIADVAKHYGADVPFTRPANISDDFATTRDVMVHAINWFSAQNQTLANVCCIYATAPFISVNDLKHTQQMLADDPSADYCFPVCEFPFPIQRGVKLDKASHVEMFQPEHFNTRSQDLEKAYHDIGQFYWGKPSAFLAGTPMFSSKAIAYPVSRNRVVDLDTPEDWEYALLLWRALEGQNKC